MDLSTGGEELFLCPEMNPQALGFLQLAKTRELGVKSRGTLSKKLIRGRSGWGSAGYHVWGCDERDGKQE